MVAHRYLERKMAHPVKVRVAEAKAPPTLRRCKAILRCCNRAIIHDDFSHLYQKEVLESHAISGDDDVAETLSKTQTVLRLSNKHFFFLTILLYYFLLTGHK